jgi:lactate permease
MTVWLQNYDPFGSAVLSTALAAAPIVVLLGLLVMGRSAVFAAIAGLATALLGAIFGFGMPPAMALASAGYGALFGLLPIGWIVLAAVFLYQLTVQSGQFEIVKRSVAALSPDRRMQALLIAFSFGSFLEGAAGFGTPVAISAALLIGLGFSPLYAAGLSLLANTSPVAFGALGTPIITLAKVSGIDEMALSQMAGRQLPLFSLMVPAWLVATMGGWRAVVGCWPAILVCGGSFASIQFLTANFHGPALVDVAGGIGSMIALMLFLQVWKPKEIWRFSDEPADLKDTRTHQDLRTGTVLFAWLPWVILSAMVFLWGWPDVKATLNAIGKPSFEVSPLHLQVARTAPIVENGVPEKAIYEFNWLSATGTGIFLAAILSAFVLRISPRRFLFIFVETAWKLREALFTIACMLALAFTA